MPLSSRPPGRPRPLGYVPKSVGRVGREQKGWVMGVLWAWQGLPAPVTALTRQARCCPSPGDGEGRAC